LHDLSRLISLTTKEGRNMALYVVVDSNNYWPTYGEFDTAEDALRNAARSGNLDNPETLYAFKVVNETVWTEAQIKQAEEED
jgi:hypothetical protein